MKSNPGGGMPKMYKGSDGDLTTREGHEKMLRIIAKKRLTTIIRRKQLGGQSAWEKMYNSSKRIGGPRKGGR